LPVFIALLDSIPVPGMLIDHPFEEHVHIILVIFNLSVLLL
jgi:hypothetical protein